MTRLRVGIHSLIITHFRPQQFEATRPRPRRMATASATPSTFAGWPGVMNLYAVGLMSDWSCFDAIGRFTLVIRTSVIRPYIICEGNKLLKAFLIQKWTLLKNRGSKVGISNLDHPYPGYSEYPMCYWVEFKSAYISAKIRAISSHGRHENMVIVRCSQR